MPFQGTMGPGLYFFFSFPTTREWFCSATSLYHDPLPHHRPRATGTVDDRLTSSNWEPNKPLFLYTGLNAVCMIVTEIRLRQSQTQQ